MDPFEARLQFIQMLESMNPSQVTINKAIQFSLKNQELHEDFHSCILEVLGRIDLNARINVLYFLQGLITAILGNASAQDLENRPYVKHIKRDIAVILQLALPDNNLVNLRNCVDIFINAERLYGIRNESRVKKYFKLELGDDLSLPDSEDDQDEDFIKGWRFLISCKHKSLVERDTQLKTKEELNDKHALLTKEQILHRMETDRERHKRSKETSWIVNRGASQSLTVNKNGIDLAEFDNIWDKFGAITKQDLREMTEMSEVARQSYQL